MIKFKNILLIYMLVIYTLSFDISCVYGIDFNTKDYSCYDFAYVANMLYSDYCNIFTDATYYIKMAKNYLEDPDYMGDPSERAYHDAIKRIKYHKY